MIKKEYMKPSLKVVELKQNCQIQVSCTGNKGCSQSPDKKNLLDGTVSNI